MKAQLSTDRRLLEEQTLKDDVGLKRTGYNW